MEANTQIITLYPALSNQICTCMNPNAPYTLQNDSNGLGTYIKTWNYASPKPLLTLTDNAV